MNNLSNVPAGYNDQGEIGINNYSTDEGEITESDCDCEPRLTRALISKRD